MSDKVVGGWLKLPESGRSAEFERASSGRVELENGRHAHPDGSTGTFTDKNCPICKKEK
jgi:hypothetical protein